jgi:DME family drug/metabolite transporter
MRGRSQLLLAAVLFGTTGTAQALGPDTSSPLTVGAARIVLGGAALAVIALLDGPSPIRALRPLLLAAGAAVALYQLTFFEAVARAGVALGAVVAIGSGPIVAGLLERATAGAWPGRRWLAATALALTGVATLSAGGGATNSTIGIALALVSGTCYAGYTVAARHLIQAGAPPASVMGSAFGIAAVVLVPVLALGDNAWLWTPRGAALALYLAAVPTVIAYLLFARGLRTIAASEATTIILAEPLTALVLGVAALHEHFDGTAVAGATLVLVGLAALAFPARGTSEHQPRP